MEDSNNHGFSTPTPDDHRPWLWTAALISCAYSTLALGARVTSKWDMLWYDDIVLGVAYLLAYSHYGVLFASISSGLGTTNDSLTPAEVNTAAMTFFSARVLLILALCISKLSVLAFTRRIFSGNLYSEKIIFSTAGALCAAWGVMAALLSSVGCTPRNSLIASEDVVCGANRTRWIIITVLDVVTELLLLAVPIWLVSKNQIKASKKRVVAFVFAFRLVVGAFAIATAVTYFKFFDNKQDNIGMSDTVVWQEVLLGVSLISASIPSLRSFLWAFMSRGVFTMYGIDSKHSFSGSIPMRSVTKSNNRSQPPSQALAEHDPVQTRNMGRLRPDWMVYSVDVSRGAQAPPREKRHSGSMKSDSSEQMFIHRNVEFEVR